MDYLDDYDEDSMEDDLEIHALFAALGTNKEIFNHVVQFLSEEDSWIANEMVERGKYTISSEVFNDWITSRVVVLIEAEKKRQGIQTIH